MSLILLYNAPPFLQEVKTEAKARCHREFQIIIMCLSVCKLMEA
jgi:hypothetical protein